MSRLALPALALLVGLGLLVVATEPSRAQGKGKGKAPVVKKYVEGQNHLQGKARWEWKLTPEGGGGVEKGTFMCYVDGEITTGKPAKHIGTWKATDKDQITAIFTAGKLGGGTADIRLVSANPPIYVGTLRRKGGQGGKLHIDIVND